MNHRQYRQAAHYNVTHLRRLSFYSLPTAHIDILSEPPFSLPSTFRAVDEAIDANADIAEAILTEGLPAFGIGSDNESWKNQATPKDLEKAQSTIKQLYRDWSAEGAAERDACYAPIFQALVMNPPPNLPLTAHHYNVLVPGAGLGRLVLELGKLGYAVQGTYSDWYNHSP